MNTATTTTTKATRGAGVAVNVVLFQIGWFACVLSAAQGQPWIGTVAAAVIVAWHVLRAAQPRQELKLIVSVVILGALWDSVLVMLGWISYTSGTLIAGAAPHWILALWALFATSLNVSMRWLKQRLLWAAVLGAISGPLSYWAAARLGAAQLVEPLPILVALAVGWALIMPGLMRLSRGYDGIAVTRGTPA
jgi:hypothetical protein